MNFLIGMKIMKMIPDWSIPLFQRRKNFVMSYSNFTESEKRQQIAFCFTYSIELSL